MNVQHNKEISRPGVLSYPNNFHCQSRKTQHLVSEFPIDQSNSTRVSSKFSCSKGTTSRTSKNYSSRLHSMTELQHCNSMNRYHKCTPVNLPELLVHGAPEIVSDYSIKVMCFNVTIQSTRGSCHHELLLIMYKFVAHVVFVSTHTCTSTCKIRGGLQKRPLQRVFGDTETFAGFQIFNADNQSTKHQNQWININQ